MSGDLKLVMCGCTEYGRYLVSKLIDKGLHFSQFVVLTPEQGERYQVSGYADLRTLAEKYDIPVYIPHDYTLSHPDDVAFFAQHRFDLLIQGGWQRLFPEALLATLRFGAVGVHGSADLLPKGRGRSPLNWSIIEGKTRFLLQLFLIKQGVDDGDVFDCEDFDINPCDSIRTLYYKNVILTERMLLRSLPGFSDGSLTLRPQRGKPTHYPKRSADDGEIDWENMSVRQINDLVRATTRPYPGAYGMLDGRPVRIWQSQIFDTRISYPDSSYGDVVEQFDDCLVVNCREGLLLISEYSEIDQ